MNAPKSSKKSSKQSKNEKMERKKAKKIIQKALFAEAPSEEPSEVVFTFTSILAEPSNDAPPMVLAVAKAVAVAELPEVF